MDCGSSTSARILSGGMFAFSHFVGGAEADPVMVGENELRRSHRVLCFGSIEPPLDRADSPTNKALRRIVRRAHRNIRFSAAQIDEVFGVDVSNRNERIRRGELGYRSDDIGSETVGIRDRHAAFRPLVLSREPPLQVGDLFHQAPANLMELSAGLREAQAARRPIEEREAEVLFESAQAARQRRVVDPHTRGGLSKRPRVRDRSEPLEVVPVEHRAF